MGSERSLEAEVRQTRAELRELRDDVRALLKLERRRSRAEEKARQSPAEVRAVQVRTLAILQRIYDEEPANRRRLAELRASEAYERAFDDPDPLVSVIIPTYSNAAGLVRAVGSVLDQTHSNLELIVVGDGARPEIGRALGEIDDPRLTYVPKEHRGPYPSDPEAFARVKGVPPFNVGVGLARGHWIAPFADDDVLRSRHLESLLGEARRGRYEFCYGRVQKRDVGGAERVSGEWPPELGRVSLQAAIYLRGLTFIQHEVADGLFGVSSDKSVLRRMLNAGVRFGFLDEVVVDYTWRAPEPRATSS